jgi:hypothetical protein
MVSGMTENHLYLTKETYDLVEEQQACTRRLGEHTTGEEYKDGFFLAIPTK